MGIGFKDGNSPKIDDQRIDGLLGANNSLGYKVNEIEKHLHNKEVWCGRAPSPVSGVVECEAWGVLPFVSTSGLANEFGVWTPLVGTNDMPYEVENEKFDMHRITITDVSNDGNKITHISQIVWGDTTPEAAIAAGNLTGFVDAPEKDGKAAPIDILIPRITSAGTKVWFRHLVIGQVNQTIDFYFGFHEYIA